MTFAVALDGRFLSFGDLSGNAPTATAQVGTAQSTVQPTDSHSPTLATAQPQGNALERPVSSDAQPFDWDSVFGKDAHLYRSNNGRRPFYILDSESVDRGKWEYNSQTNGFDFYPEEFDPTSYMFHLGQSGRYATNPTKSVSAAQLGLSDPAWQISGLATIAGKNNDSWSNYALTHNNYDGKGVGNRDGVLSGAHQLRGAFGDITGYEAKVSTFDKIGESLVIGGIVTIATMGFGAPLAASIQAAGYSAGTAAVASNAIVGAAAGGTTAAVTGGDPVKGALLGGAGGAIGGYSSTLSKTGGLLSTSNMVNTAGKTALAAVSGGDPVATLASSVAGSAAGAATDSPFVGQLASQATRQLVGNHSAQAAQQPRTAQTSSTKNTQSTQSTPGASFAYALPSFKYTDLRRGGA